MIRKFLRQAMSDDQGRASISRILWLVSFPFSTIALFYVTWITRTAEALQWYITAYAGSYICGKAIGNLWKVDNADSNDSK